MNAVVLFLILPLISFAGMLAAIGPAMRADLIREVRRELHGMRAEVRRQCQFHKFNRSRALTKEGKR